MIHLVNPVIISPSQMTFSTSGPDCESHSPDLLGLLVSADPGLSSANSVFSVSIDFP